MSYDVAAEAIAIATEAAGARCAIVRCAMRREKQVVCEQRRTAGRRSGPTARSPPAAPPSAPNAALRPAGPLKNLQTVSLSTRLR